MEEITRAEYNKDIIRIDGKNEEQDKRIGKAEKELIKLGECFKGIIELPEKVQNIDNEVAKTNLMLEKMSDTVGEALNLSKENKEEIIVQKKRGVINIDLFKIMTDNFLKIFGGTSFLYMVYELLIKGV